MATAIELNLDGKKFYIETDDQVNLPKEENRTKGGGNDSVTPIQISFDAIEGAILAYTNAVIKAFQKVDTATINKVTLEFGIKVGAEAAIPMITKGTSESNLKITVECAFPNKSTAE